MSDYTKTKICVPEYVNLEDVDKCFRDSDYEFVDIDSSTFDPASELEGCEKFVLFEKDHFVVHIKDKLPLKFHYQSRNMVMSYMGYGSDIEFNLRDFVEKDGVKVFKELPILYFVRKSDDITELFSNGTEYNTIVEYYDKEDLAEFARITKAKKNAVNHTFVVYKDDKYTCHDTDDTTISYAFSAWLKSRIIGSIREGKANIQTYIDEEKHLAEKRPKRKRDPNFRLVDHQGEEVKEGEGFFLKILRKGEPDDEEEEEEEEEEDNNDLSFFFGDAVYVADHIEDDEEPFLRGIVDAYSSFQATTIDGVTYLTHDGLFLYTDEDHEHGH
ncbi:hypothetical protein GQ54DRAFT_147273, partial [Martensiomyces pterosporus]